MLHSGGRSETVLLVGNHGPSLAVTRALAKSGYRVIVGDGGEYATVGRSRDCAEVWRHPAIHDAEAFIAALLDFLQRRPEIGILMPLLAAYLPVLAANSERLPKHVVLAMTDARTVTACLDKWRLYQIAGEAGVPFEPIKLALDLPSLASAASEVGFPCVIRPPNDTGAALPGDRKAIICRDQAALERAVPRWPEGQAGLLVQHFASGPRHNVHFAARRGRILARVETQSVRTDRLDRTGLGIEGVSVRADPRLIRHCDALIRQLDYTGIGLVQFMVPAVGEPSFLELNPRHGTALAFIQYCGLDLANAAIDLASREGTWRPPPGGSYPVGRRYAWTSKDIYGLMMARAAGEVGRVAALRWLARSAWTALRADVHLSWAIRDPRPTLAIYGSLARLAVGRRHPPE